MADLNENKLITLGNLKKYTEKIKELISNNSYQEITYSELKNLRDNSLLVPGSWYRITDYETTVFNNDNARAAGHPFDVVVLATDVNQLSEDAKAVHSARDTEGYFTHANLAAWKLKYSLDNDTTKFAWAVEGKGVIWEMEDEHNNLCPYDFKNIQFKRSLITSTKENPSEEECSFYGKYVGLAEMEVPSLPEGYAIDSNDTKFLYTFSVIDADGNVEDNSLGVDLTSADMGIMYFCKFNRIRENINDSSFAFDLNNNVFVATCNSTDEIYNLVVEGNTFGAICIYNTFVNYTTVNTFGNMCGGNTFGNGCTFNSFGNACQSNSFRDDCNNNKFEDGCINNSFGNGCSANLFGNGCQDNLFGDDCIFNSLGNGCTENSFGNGFKENSLGNGFKTNSFGNYCESNSFGNECESNSFGDAFVVNSFGNMCTNNSFGDICNYNSFGNACQHNDILNNVNSITVFENVEYVSIGSANGTVQYAQVLNGTKGDSQNRLQIDFETDVEYTQVARKGQDGKAHITPMVDCTQSDIESIF